MAQNDRKYESNQDGLVGGSSSRPTATDTLLPTKGEPEKNPAPFGHALTTLRQDSINKVLKKASSLTRKQNLNDTSDYRQRGIG